MNLLRTLCVAVLTGAATAEMSPGNFAAEVEERLWKWVRESGGFVSEAVSTAPRGDMRSIRAVKDIAAKEEIIVVPPKLQLFPEEAKKKDKFFRQMTKLKLPRESADFAMYVLRQIRLRAGRRTADPSAEAEGYDHMWDWLEFHLKAIGDYLQAWDDKDVEMLGKDQLAETLQSKREFEVSRQKVMSFVSEQCPTGSEPACADVEGLGEVTKEDFFAASHMAWSRGFADGMIVPVASLLNHAPPIFSTANFDYGEYGVSNFRVWAKRDIKAGEEITITYGNWHNHMLFVEHAFTQPPRLEPSFHFGVKTQTLKEDVFEQLDLDDDDFPEKIGLETPHLYEDDDDEPWDPEYELESVKEIVSLGGLPALEKLVNFYAEGLEKDPMVTPFIEQLARNRAQNRTSRVWWADENDAETSDASDADAMGSARKSHAVRILMSRVLCLTIYREALLLEKGDLDAEDAIVSAVELSEHLGEMKSEVGDNARDALFKATAVVKKAVAKAKFANIPEEELIAARKFISEQEQERVISEMGKGEKQKKAKKEEL